ncbi:MAG: acyl-[acyl-carrier-protein]--UDP-N-acetylglucosamine O-acyltransferase, partial [Rhodobacteraceae bacterium]|nr:acyl-[acyl-carrier-protein]--UDP-N-acetylglucosamine O-acyltransferase [Paracoccaceae bacterium]
HPSAHIEAGAVIGPDCRIGPFCLIGADVRLGRGVTVKSHAVVTGDTRIGDETTIFP